MKKLVFVFCLLATISNAQVGILISGGGGGGGGGGGQGPPGPAGSVPNPWTNTFDAGRFSLTNMTGMTASTGTFSTMVSTTVEVSAIQSISGGAVNITSALNLTGQNVNNMADGTSPTSAATVEQITAATSGALTNGGTPFISVTAFGAIGDGVRDNTTNFQKALDYVGSNSIALWIPTGNYVISNQLNVTGTVRVQGGSGADVGSVNAPQITYKGTGTLFNCVAIGANTGPIHNLFQGLYLLGPGATTSQNTYGVRILMGRGLSAVDNCQVSGFDVGVQDFQSTGFRFSQNRLENNGIGVLVDGFTGDTVLDRNWIGYNLVAGIQLGVLGDATSPENTTIVGGDGIETNGVPGLLLVKGSRTTIIGWHHETGDNNTSDVIATNGNNLALINCSFPGNFTSNGAYVVQVDGASVLDLFGGEYTHGNNVHGNAAIKQTTFNNGPLTYAFSRSAVPLIDQYDTPGYQHTYKALQILSGVTLAPLPITGSSNDASGNVVIGTNTTTGITNGLTDAMVFNGSVTMGGNLIASNAVLYPGILLTNNTTLGIVTQGLYICDSTAGVFTNTLPATDLDIPIVFYLTNATPSPVTIACTSTRTINGQSSFTMSNQFEVLKLVQLRIGTHAQWYATDNFVLPNGTVIGNGLTTTTTTNINLSLFASNTITFTNVFGNRATVMVSGGWGTLVGNSRVTAYLIDNLASEVVTSFFDRAVGVGADIETGSYSLVIPNVSNNAIISLVTNITTTSDTISVNQIQVRY